MRRQPARVLMPVAMATACGSSSICTPVLVATMYRPRGSRAPPPGRPCRSAAGHHGQRRAQVGIELELLAPAARWTSGSRRRRASQRALQRQPAVRRMLSAWPAAAVAATFPPSRPAICRSPLEQGLQRVERAARWHRRSRGDAVAEGSGWRGDACGHGVGAGKLGHRRGGPAPPVPNRIATHRRETCARFHLDGARRGNRRTGASAVRSSYGNNR